MDASKENAREALKKFKAIPTADQRDEAFEEATFIQNFLEAVVKRLPSQAAIDKDRQRKKKYNRKSVNQAS